MRELAIFAFSCSLACGGLVVGSDAGADADGGTCVDLDVNSFDTSCAADTDCIAVAAPGVVCSGYNCLCPGSAINADGGAAYEALLSKIKPGPGPQCGCPALGQPRCVAAHCTFCPNPAFGGPIPPGCPDGG